MGADANTNDDRTRADALRRHLCGRLEAYDLGQLQLVDVAMVRIDHSNDRVRDGLAELRGARVNVGGKA